MRTKNMNCCPTCKRAYAKPRGSSELKLKQDIEKTQRSIELLRNAQPDPMIRYNPPSLFADAIQDEIRRLEYAIEHPVKLWAIYRRADKGIPYFSETESRVVPYYAVKQETARRKAA